MRRPSSQGAKQTPQARRAGYHQCPGSRKPLVNSPGKGSRSFLKSGRIRSWPPPSRRASARAERRRWCCRRSDAGMQVSGRSDGRPPPSTRRASTSSGHGSRPQAGSSDFRATPGNASGSGSKTGTTSFAPARSGHADGKDGLESPGHHRNGKTNGHAWGPGGTT